MIITKNINIGTMEDIKIAKHKLRLAKIKEAIKNEDAKSFGEILLDMIGTGDLLVLFSEMDAYYIREAMYWCDGFTALYTFAIQNGLLIRDEE